MPERLITPSKITAWLDCPHYLTLRSQVDNQLMTEPRSVFGSFARLLADKGLSHERDCLDHYRRQGKSILIVPEKRDGESFSGWVERVGNPFGEGWDVVYQMPFVHDGIRGVADFLVRVTNPTTDRVSYEPVDAKLTRRDAKPGHVLQLCFYADAIRELTHVEPMDMHVWLGSGRLESLRVNDFLPYWRRLRGQLGSALAAGPSAGTTPRPCSHCPFCEFETVCEEQWRRADSLIYVAGIRQPEIEALATAGVATLGKLARTTQPVEGMVSERLARLAGQAELQVQARGQTAVPFSIVPPGDDPQWGHGFEALPEPDAGDVFVDFEGHPFWRADAGLFFLFGLLESDDVGQWRYRTWWAHDLRQEGVAAAELIDYIARRRQQFPEMHAYHYNHTERSALQAMADSHDVAEAQLAKLVSTGAFVDLYDVARNSVQVGAESYGLKYLERLTEFERSHEIDQGAGAVVQYERYMTHGDEADRHAIAVYNEDDVRATRALRDWLVSHRPPEMPWRPAHTDPESGVAELEARVVRLHAFGAGTPHHLLGDLIGYWRREWFAYIAPKMVKLNEDPADVMATPDVLAGLELTGRVERVNRKGEEVTPAMRFVFPPQALDKFPRQGGSVIMVTGRPPDGKRIYAGIDRLDRQSGEVDLLWSEKLEQSGYVPRVVVLDEWVDATSKAVALQSFAGDVLDGTAPNEVTMSLLRRELPRFAGAGPAGGVFGDDLADMTAWVTRLDHSFVAIQGPPGTGKTYSAARLVHALVLDGARVGIAAVSHAAIDNLLEAIVAVFAANGDGGLFRAIRNPGGNPARFADITYGDNKRCARAEFNLVGGTTWLFASSQMCGSPVDVLLIDEASQLSLADALAASLSARNLILLGDPLQLPQVAQADHPGGSGVSVLEHVLGNDVTLPADRGVFLAETRRMHPDVCGFVSEQFYEGRLHSHKDCVKQSTVAGTGLRWLRALHQGNATASVQEADLIAGEILRLFGTEWTDHHGVKRPLGVTDFMVVAPYNDQVHTIEERLARQSETAAVPVGTVDKFQGREAAVVFFSMATSSGEDMIRNAEFLFSRNRLNVAVSRARCLAYLTCTEELLNARARTVDDMRLIATLNAFVEDAQRQSAAYVAGGL
jgi:predicted RecB family nuclease